MSQFFNPYIAMGDNPVSQVDPLGSWVHTGPSAGGMVANAQAEGMRNIQKQLTQMNYNAAMAAGTPGGGGMPFVMNRGGSYWLAPSQEQMDWMAISGSTVMASGNGQVFSINNKGELLLGHTEYSIHSYQIYGNQAFDFYDYTSTHLPAIGIDYSDGVQVYAKQEVTSETFITDFNLGNPNNYYPGPDMPSIPHNYAEGIHGGEISMNIVHLAAKEAWKKEVNLLTRGVKVFGKALGVVSIFNRANSFLDNPSENWFDGVAAIGQVIFMVSGGAEAELIFNVGAAIVDQIREH